MSKCYSNDAEMRTISIKSVSINLLYQNYKNMLNIYFFFKAIISNGKSNFNLNWFWAIFLLFMILFYADVRI